MSPGGSRSFYLAAVAEGCYGHFLDEVGGPPGQFLADPGAVGTAAANKDAGRLCREPAPDRAALLAVLDGDVAGCGSYELLGADSVSAEVAMAVADDMHNRGVGTLLEHLISLARRRGCAHLSRRR
jgi:GNAT superfamily N-acetyltransferase